MASDVRDSRESTGNSLLEWYQSRRGRIEEHLHDRDTRVITTALLFAMALLVGLFIYWIVLLTELPTARALERSGFEQATVVYSADGVELTTYQDRNRSWVELDAISPWVTQALIATEDHRFYRHHGIDVLRTAGSVIKTLTGDLQGGSTITMQLARNAFPDIYDDWMITRKVKEWITAVRIEAMYDKEDILEMYLNTVPFMYNAFGIEAASQTYFKVPARDLNVKGAATLVGMLKGTVYYNPVRHPERSHERRNVVLSQMVERGYLEQAGFDSLREKITTLEFERLSRADEPAPHFAEYLRQWLDGWAEQRGANLYTDGLRVYTSINSTLQQAGQAAVDEIGARLQDVADGSVPVSSFWNQNPDAVNTLIRQTGRYRLLTAAGVGDGAALDSLRAMPAFADSLQHVLRRVQAGFVAINPRNGQVVAWVGGRDFAETQFDHVAMAKRQPGSTFKPFVYTAALASGYSQTSLMRDQEVAYVDPDTRRRWQPSNVGGASGRLMTLSDALAYSKNTITAQLVQEIGAGRVVDVAHQMGIQSELRAVPSIGLGTSEVSLFELAGAYATLANYGTYREPTFVTRIEDVRGNVIDRFGSSSRQAISSTVAYSVLDMMRGVADRGTGVRIRHTYGVRGDVAAKTGTSQEGADGWFMLVHPNMVMGAWVGFTSPSIHFQSSYYQQGAHTALPIVGRFYQRVHADSSELLSVEAAFRPPAGWTAPQPVDTSTASEYLFASYEDSMGVWRDSLFSQRSDSGRYDPNDAMWSDTANALENPEEFGQLFGVDDDEAMAEDEPEPSSADTAAGNVDEAGAFGERVAADVVDESDIEDVEAADSLNRMERLGPADLP